MHSVIVQAIILKLMVYPHKRFILQNSNFLIEFSPSQKTLAKILHFFHPADSLFVFHSLYHFEIQFNTQLWNLCQKIPTLLHNSFNGPRLKVSTTIQTLALGDDLSRNVEMFCQ